MNEREGFTTKKVGNIGDIIARNQALAGRIGEMGIQARNIADRTVGSQAHDLERGLGEVDAASALGQLEDTQDSITRGIDILERELARLDASLSIPPRAHNPGSVRRIG